MPVKFKKYYLEELNTLKIDNENGESKQPNIYDKLYNLYAPKVYGFILTYTDNKDEAHNYLSKVFTHAANNTRLLNDISEKRILLSVLLICKPLYKRETICA